MSNFRDVRFRVTSPEASAAFQELAFAAGARWSGSDLYAKKVSYTNYPFLYVDAQGYLGHGNTESFFNGIGMESYPTEIVLEAKTTYEVTEIRPTIEIDGKKYDKRIVETFLSTLETL